jgi:hypothetical protein
MKEADDGAGQQAEPNPAGSEPDNGKLSKDMKGLVYQGGPAGEEPSGQMPESYPEEEPNIGGAKEKGPPLSAESSTILNFTEKDSRLKAIILFAIVVVIIVAVAYLVLHSKVINTSKTVSTTSTIWTSNTPTTTVAPNFNKTDIMNIDVLYNYTGPPAVNGLNCGKTKTSTVDTYSKYLNASQTFVIYDTEHTSNCALTIRKYVALTPGFKVLAVTPVPTPFTIPGNSSSEEIGIEIRAPPFNYTGQLSLRIDEN